MCISYAAAECLAAFPPPLISWTRSLSQCALLTAWSRYFSMCTAHTTPTCVTTWGRVEIVNGVNNFPQPLTWFLLAANFYQGHYADLQLRTDLQSSCHKVSSDPLINLQQTFVTKQYSNEHITMSSHDIKCRNAANCRPAQCHPRLPSIGCESREGRGLILFGEILS